LPKDQVNENLGFVRISDPDEPIYRIFPLWFLEESLRLKQLALVSPELWEDPYELVPDNIIIDDGSTPSGTHHIIQYLRPTFAQAWSRTRESDTLLRAYSRVVKDPHFNRNICPRDEGVRVRSTPRKLLVALQTWCPTDFGRTCFIGAVQYFPKDQLLQQFANLIGSKGKDFSTLVKHEHFSCSSSDMSSPTSLKFD
jgi:hypothetical protein